MAWETRNGRGRYYTRSQRVNGRVVRQYVGTGPMAELIALQDAERQAFRLQEQQAWQREKAAIEASEKAVSRSSAQLWDAIRLILTANGFYRHHRGEWRRRRV